MLAYFKDMNTILTLGSEKSFVGWSKGTLAQEEGCLQVLSSVDELTANVNRTLGKWRRTCVGSDAVSGASAGEGLLFFIMRYKTGTGNIASVQWNMFLTKCII